MKQAKQDNPLTKIRDFCRDQQQLVQALNRAEKRTVRAQAALDEARRKLAQSESQRLMEVDDDDPAMASTPETAALAEQMLAMEQCRAACGGLRKRIRMRDGDALLIAQELQQLRHTSNEQTRDAWLCDTFAPAAQAFVAVLQQGAALEEALDITIEALHTLPSIDHWQTNAEAVLLHEQHSEMRLLGQSIDGWRREAEVRQAIEERDRRQRKEFSPTATFEVTRPFMAYSKHYEPGDKVDQNSMDLKLLSQLWAAKRLKVLDAYVVYDQ